MTRRGLAIATACAGGFLAFLDTTIVNTAFPGIASSFPGSSATDLAWVLDAYFIAVAALLVPAGGIADRIGRRRVFLGGIVAFTAASAACAAAPGLELLIAARAVQGAGAAVVMAVSLALILPEYPTAQRASAVAVWGASAALAAASGPPLGGALVELDWRWVFVVNIPIGALVLLAGRAAFDEQRDARMTGLPDLLGAALIMAGLGTLSLAILEGGTWGWTSPWVLGAFALSALVLAAAAHRCRTHPRPVLDPALLRIASFARANVGIVLLGMAFFSTILANVLFLVGVWGYSVAVAGLAVVPGAIATAAVAVPAGRVAERFGHGAVIVPGCILYVAGMAIVRGAGADPAFLATWLPAMVLNGAGLGLAFPALAAAALRDVPEEHFGAASAVTSATRQLGGVLGTAVLFAVGTPITLAAAEDAYVVSTLWALGAGVVAATLHGRVLNLGLGAMVLTGALVLAGPAAAQTTDFIGPIISKPKQVPRLAAAAVPTKTAITTPAGPVYRLLDTEPKAAEQIRVEGTTDGAVGDLLDLVCTRGESQARVVQNVAVGKDGRFETTFGIDKLKPAACVLRAVPYKYASKELDAFTGPLVAITYFNPRTAVTDVLEGERPVALDYEVETGHRHGHATLTATAGVKAHFGVSGTLDRFAARTWDGGARLEAVMVDGRAAAVGAAVPRFDYEGRPTAPRGFDGVQAAATVDPVTGAVVVTETARALRCADLACRTVLDTGVRRERRISLGAEHAVVGVDDRWLSTDKAPHQVRVEYAHRAAAQRWRFPGTPAFRTPAPAEPVEPGRLLVHDGTPAQAMGALAFDPTPELLVFSGPSELIDATSITTPATVRRLFEVGENLVQADPVPPAPAPSPVPGAPEGGTDQRPQPQPPQRCVVPRVRVGATLPTVRTALKRAGCSAGRTHKRRSAKVKRGRVIGLARTAGTSLPPNHLVGIKVSRGRR